MGVDVREFAWTDTMMKALMAVVDNDRPTGWRQKDLARAVSKFGWRVTPAEVRAAIRDLQGYGLLEHRDGRIHATSLGVDAVTIYRNARARFKAAPSPPFAAVAA